MTQFELDLKKQMRVNDGYMSVAVYNLLVSIRDVKLYRIGLKPHRNWQISHVKNYFGIKGNKDTILQELNRLKDELKQL
jgi:hypothetical protein